ncbi:MAG: hypothetical protein MOB07_29745 [Acidobacteria bacterium]|nr:hypothetical protein [Acidobacteriota bacterium]
MILSHVIKAEGNPSEWIRWKCPTLIILFFLIAFSGCERDSNSAPTPSEKQKVKGIQEGEIIDSVGSKELFEERRALWLKNAPRHYRLKFAFTCDCHLDTTQIQEVKKDGKVIMERSGSLLTIEVKDGKVIGIYKEDGEPVPVKEYRIEGTPSGLVEYIWNIGKNENDEQKLLSEPIELLWKRGQEAIQSKPEKKFTITYDKQFGFIKRI